MPLSSIAEQGKGTAVFTWLRFWDSAERRHYFYNPVTEETAWQGSFESGDPPFEDGDEESAAADAGALPLL